MSPSSPEGICSVGRQGEVEDRNARCEAREGDQEPLPSGVSLLEAEGCNAATEDERDHPVALE